MFEKPKHGKGYNNGVNLFLYFPSIDYIHVYDKFGCNTVAKIKIKWKSQTLKK